jgi:uncharacterized protein YkwD
MKLPGDTAFMEGRLAVVLLSALALLAMTAASASANAMLAPSDVCPGQTKLRAPAVAQERSMLCMANYARAQFGLEALEPASQLEGSATQKGRDIFRCDNFSHYACEREFSYWIRASGYVSVPCWRAGENLAFGNGRRGNVRAIFRAWMRSADHRVNILGDYTQTGLFLASGSLEGFSGTRVWAQHFGKHC